MTTVTVTAVTDDDIDALVTSVAGPFAEDAGQHDPSVNLDWPAREGTAYYTGLMQNLGSLLLLARDGDRVTGHLVGKLVAHFIAWAREHGAQQATVTAYAANHTAQRLYARHGFAPASVTLRATL